MTESCSLILDANTTLAVPTESVRMMIEKDITAVKDDSNVIRVQDAVRNQRTWILTLSLSTAARETLVQFYRSAITADYPTFRYYDKSTTPYYNDYKVYFSSYDERPLKVGSNGLFTVVLTVKERS